MTLTQENVQYKINDELVEQGFEDDIKSLIEWQNKQPHLPNVTDDKLIVIFYKVLNQNLQKTKTAIDAYYTNAYEFFKFYPHWDIVEQRVSQFLDVACVAMLPERLPSGNFVQIFSFFDTDPEKFVYEDYFMTTHFLMVVSQLRCTAPAKYCFIIDMTGFSLQYIMNIGLTRFKFLTSLGKNMAKAFIKEIHYINCPLQNSMLINLIQSMTNSSKFQVYFHPSVDCLTEHFPKSILPQEFGGNGLNLKQLSEISRKDALSVADIVRSQRMNYVVDETKRPDASKLIAESMFGVEGSFKKLQID